MPGPCGADSVRGELQRAQRCGREVDRAQNARQGQSMVGGQYAWRHGQDRARRLAQDLLGDRAEQQTFEPGAAVRAHDDQIGIPVRRAIENPRDRVTLEKSGRQRDAGGIDIVDERGDVGLQRGAG